MSIVRAKRLDLKITRQLTEKQQENSKINEEEALEGKTVLKSYPRRLVLEMTNACNISCKMCGRNAVDFKPTIFNREWIEIFEPIADKIEEVTLLGWGEPTLHPQFSEFLEWAHSKKIRKYFCTNGTKLDKLKDDIFKYEVDLLTVSLDGADKAINDSIRCGSDFDKIIADVSAIVEQKKALGVDYPHISFVMTMMQSNFKQFPDYVRLAKKVGIEEVKGVYLTVFDDFMADELIYNCQDEFKKVFTESEKLGEELGIIVKLPHLQGEDIAGEEFHKDCYVGWRDFFLGSDGYVRGCMSTPDKLFKVDKYKTFDEMWNSEEYVEFRKCVNSENMPRACSDCYQCAVANWNRKVSFDQRGKNFAPEWE